jgi:PD-(D/E)XK nuclease superfamily
MPPSKKATPKKAVKAPQPSKKFTFAPPAKPRQPAKATKPMLPTTTAKPKRPAGIAAPASLDAAFLTAKPPLAGVAIRAKAEPLAMLSSWSYSVYTQYMKCPLSVCFDKIKKIRIVEPPNQHFEKGDRVHKAAEDYIRGTGKAPAVIPELASVKDRLAFFRQARAQVELEWSFTREFQPTSWFGKDAWLRVKTDVCLDAVEPPLVHITDWKTGKVYDDHRQQRSLYALAGLQLVELGRLAGGSKDVKLTAEHLYTDTTQSATEEYGMRDLKPLKREWAARIGTMMTDTRYPPKTGFHCRYCKFRKSAGGPCPENQ